jgi:hypothetical protein
MRGRRGGDSMVVGFVTTYATSAYHCGFESRAGKVYSHYVIKFVSDLQLVGGFLRVLWFSPQIIQTTAIYILLKVALSTLFLTIALHLPWQNKYTTYSN